MSKPVPEIVLKKRQVDDAALKKEKLARKAKAKEGRKQKKEAFKRAVEYVKEYREMEAHQEELRTQARDLGGFYREPEAKVALVIRIRGINGLDPKPRKVLRLLRLLQINNAVFVRLNKAMINMLRLVEPYIAYGYPSLKTVRELVYKRGYGKINRSRIPLTSNQVIQDALKKYDVICAEDIVHEIYTCGPNFKYVSNFLWPFKLNNPVGGWKRKSTHYNEGGDCGNREDLINGLVAKMV